MTGHFRSGFQPLRQHEGSKPLTEAVSLSFCHQGETFVACQSGALYWPEHDALLVADLHLEKGSAFARSGQFLPPYDSQSTLAQLRSDIALFRPRKVICLGDSFHDVEGPERLAPHVKTLLTDLTDLQEWVWILGNHDPVIPAHLGGMAGETISFAGEANRVILTHEPGSTGDGILEDCLEICGHLHPVATVSARGRSMRRKCFVLTPERIIMPAYGSYTGGLNVRDAAFTPFLSGKSELLVIGNRTLTRSRLAVASRRRTR